ncbi:hypothetical protein PHLGIDRAFT_31821 [Phlebiopsis gigantea 11061_1 CR5-6]|uniref:Initiator tRNA phosphoribosyl transferase n=1 Tax=Phlebiopsis gigantea (strain 11061_1 CR5-6) TaxID=745531 RepID=A0A0C3PDM4_PHLG1|nr:hypothetical protein PHLGIDRAFT_31821 [Phlebiopsis gigantea 11061_1 CR5-6]
MLEDVVSERHLESQALAHIRRESLDLYNRVHSIAEDCDFVNTVRQAYKDLPLIPNLRCGAWYADPAIVASEAAYFKSTDGHFNNWSFNLRRPNIHLLHLIADHGGFLLVDATRSGKRMPDALSKTVPIWCSVINRAVALRHQKNAEWDTSVYTSPAAVSRQEHAQIETRLQAWASALNKSSYELPDLQLPLRPFWITPSASSYPHLPPLCERTFYPVICISASKQISDGLERRSKGYAYVQGSGDDHELWGQGLTPDVYWANKDRILATDRASLPTVMQELVAGHATATHETGHSAPTPISRVQGRLLIGRTSDVPQPPPARLPSTDRQVAFVFISESPPHTGSDDGEGGAPSREDVLSMELPQGKRGQKQFLDAVLPQSMQFIASQLSAGVAVCICCDSGKDVSVGVALTALQALFDDDGQFLTAPSQAADKRSIRTRLQWIITSRPEANPSRATLKRVNEYLMTPIGLRSR